MNNKLYLGIRIPNRAHEYIPLENINLNGNVCSLKGEIAKKIDFPKDDIELIYQGNVLEDEEKIESKIADSSTIHVFKKTKKYQPYVPTKTYTAEDYLRIANLFGTVTHAQINVCVRINVLQKILAEYPEFLRNLGAQALIRDSVLFHNLDKPEVIEKVAENYPVICDAAEFIVKTIKKELVRTETVAQNEESLSDVTSSSEEENSSSSISQSEQARIRRISRDQLAAALMHAGTASINSLSNIAQRNSSFEEQASALRAAASSPGRISTSVFSNALARALEFGSAGSQSTEESDTGLEQVQNMDTTETQDASTDSEQNTSLPSRYRTHEWAIELCLMRQMGLTNDTLNLRVLNITNGNVENAINLVLASPDLENDLR